MKKMRFVLFAVAAMAAASCAKELAPENGKENTPAANLVPMTFTAGTEATKVALQEDGKTLHWEATDQLKVFDGVSNELPAFTTTESGASVTFAGQVSDGATGPFYALYPYQAAATFGASTITTAEYGDVITATVPAEQTAVAGGVPANAFIAAAVSDNKDNFTFKTICGFIKFQLSEEDAAGAVAVSISGNDLAAIAGDVEIFFSKAGAEAFGQDYVRGATKDYVTLTGSFKADTDYYFAIRSNKFASGFTMTIKYEDGSCKHVTTTQAAPQTISRNMVMNIGKPVFKAGLPSNQYIAWQHGASLNIAGTEYSKEKNGAATLIKAATNISKPGVYFVNPGFTATVTANINSIVLIGTDPSNRATIAVNKAFKPTGSNPIAIANADVTYANTNQLFQLSADTDKITFENCSFKNIQHTFINGGNDFKVDIVSIKDCEIQIVGSNKGSSYIYYSKNTTEHSLFNIVNCVFYYRLADGKTDLIDFKVCQSGGTIKDVNVVQNTFDKTIIPNAGLVKTSKLSGTLNINNNLYNDVVAASAHSNILGLDTKTGEILPIGGNITNNFFYKSDSTIEKNLIINRTGLEALPKLGSPQPTLNGVLASDWDPDNKKFGKAAEVQYINSQNETITVSTVGVGAQR